MRHRRLAIVGLFLGTTLALALVVLTLSNGMRSSAAQQGLMHNCPELDRWAVSVWVGDDDTDTGEAVDSCGEGTVAAVYFIDPSTQDWLRWFPGRPELSDLLGLDSLQGVLALGAARTATPTATPSTSVTPLATGTPTATPTETVASGGTPSATAAPSGTASPYSDRDSDGIANAADNCPFDVNPGQEDTCSGPLGDACDCGGEFCWFTPGGLNVEFESGTSTGRIGEIASTVGATVKIEDCLVFEHTWCFFDLPPDDEITYYMALLAGFSDVLYADPNCFFVTQ